MADYNMVGGPENQATGRRKKKQGVLGLYNPPEYLNTRVASTMKMRQEARRPKVRAVPRMKGGRNIGT